MSERPTVLHPPAGHGFGGAFVVPPDLPADTLDQLLKIGYSPAEYEAEDREEAERQAKRDKRKDKA